MPIPVITNFSINDTVPFDTRLVATSSTSMANMLYKYEGLTTYRSDLGLNYTYDGSTWSVSSNGIYGGSGNLSSDTTVNFGTVSTSLNDKSNYFTFRGYDFYYIDFGTSYVDLENYFIRNTQNSSGSFGEDGVSYISQLVFYNPEPGIETYYGPYIRYNPPPLFNSGIGGISFGTRNGNFGVSERMRIDGNGIIRFKPNLIVNDSTKSVNIGIDSTDTSDTRPFIGFNWNGSAVDTGTDASYVQFNDSVVSIHNFSSTTGTHSAIFSKGLVRVNGALEVTGGTISTNKNISFGAADGGVYFVSSNGIGMKYDSSSKNYAALTYRQGSTIKDILKWDFRDITLQVNTSTTQSATFTTYGPFNAKNPTNIWDNNFDRFLESEWFPSEMTGDIVGQDLESNTILVNIATGALGTTPVGDSKFYDFVFTTKPPYTAITAKSSWVLYPISYDRYLYFYLENENFPVSHLVEWFLMNDLSDPLEPTDWVKIGRYENGNKGNYNIDAPGSTFNYQTRFYSHSVLIPANMYFKISFVFNKTFRISNSFNNILSFVRTRIIRAGKWSTAAPGPRG